MITLFKILGCSLAGASFWCAGLYDERYNERCWLLLIAGTIELYVVVGL